jgi:hypothetical protein
VHFEVKVGILLREPLALPLQDPPPGRPPESLLRKLKKPLVGYRLLLLVKAEDIIAAAALARDAALKITDTTGQPIGGYVKFLRITAIRPRTWPEVTRQLAANISSGVYYSSGPGWYHSKKDLLR